MADSIPKLMIRRKVREVLAMQPGFPKTEIFIHQAVNQLCGGGVSLQDSRDAIEWNLQQNFIRSERDEEAETVGWFITPLGQAKQAVQ